MRIGLVGKYVSLPDAYLSVVEALKHGGFHHGAKVEIDWIQAEDVEGLLAEGRLRDLDGIVIPGGFGERGIEGKIAAAGYAREHDIPCLGLCLGLQVMTIEFARNVLRPRRRQLERVRPADARTRSSTSWTTQRDVVDMGGTMRLGAYVGRARSPARMVAEAYGDEVVSERHRHRYEFNPRYRGQLRGRRPRAARARRPTAGWSSSSSSTATRSGSAPRPTPSSRAGPTARTRCSASSSAPPCDRAEGRNAAPRSTSTSRARPRRPDAVALASTVGDRPSARDRRFAQRRRAELHLHRARVIYAGRVSGRARTFAAPTARPSSATSCTIPARCRSCPLIAATDGACSSASTGPPSTTTCSRSRPASATSRASRPRSPPTGSWPRRSGYRPAASCSWPSSTTRPASATSTPTCSSPST